MDFDRLLKPHSQPRMFLSAESGGNDERDPDARCFLRPDFPEVDDRSASSSDTFKDVDMVFSLPNSSPMSDDSALNQHLSQALESLEVDHHGSYNLSPFEFQKNRSSVPLSSKTAPSKWDDAEKWIASPNSNKSTKICGSQIRRTVGGTVSRENRIFSAKMLEISEESDSQAADLESSKMNYAFFNPIADFPAVPINHPIISINVSEQSPSSAIECSTLLTLPAAIRSVSMKDTGTEMTPIASQETSRTGTPKREASPLRGPASSSLPSSPDRSAPCSKPVDSVDSMVTSNNKELSDKELQMRTRREIMILGTQLGKPNIAAWASKEEVNKPGPTKEVKSTTGKLPVPSIIDIRAAAWEEAEKAKNIAVFKRQEMQIRAWEDHQKAKIEAETRKIEVKVERMRASAHKQLMAQLAAARLKAEAKRLAAEAKRNRRASRTTRQVDYIRRTGRVPLSFSLCWACYC